MNTDRVFYIRDETGGREAISDVAGAAVDCFALRTNRSMQQRVDGALRAAGAKPGRWHDSARLVSEAVDVLRQGLGQWADGIGEAVVDGRSVKEWLQLPGENVSAWWFGMLVERNPMKTDAFIQMAQINAVRDVILRERYGRCVLAVRDGALRKMLMSLTARHGCRTRATGGETAYFMSGGLRIISLWWSSVRVLGRMLLRGLWARLRLGPLAPRIHRDAPSLLFLTYFPQIDEAAAKKGVFVNRYAGGLQELFASCRIPILWVLMYVKIRENGFRRSVSMAKKCVQQGERMSFVEEFVRLGDVLRAVLLRGRIARCAGRLWKELVRRDELGRDPVGLDARPIVEQLWMESFCGRTAMQEILLYLAFKRMFQETGNVSDCIYFAEMIAWEKALNAAKKHVAPNVRTIGYQHSSVSKNWFPFFVDPSEMQVGRGAASMPMPDIMACTSTLQQQAFNASGYRNMRIVEAVRYHYLIDVLDRPAVRRGRKTLLVAGSMERRETLSLVSLAAEAYPRAEGFELIFRGHPALPMELMFEELDIDFEARGYIIAQGDLHASLESAFAVIVPSSTLAIEALSCGCEVIGPIFPDSIDMNPLVEFEGYCRSVTSAQDLVRTVDEIRAGAHLKSHVEYCDFVRRYWCLDRQLPRWRELMNKECRMCV